MVRVRVLGGLTEVGLDEVLGVELVIEDGGHGRDEEEPWAGLGFLQLGFWKGNFAGFWSVAVEIGEGFYEFFFFFFIFGRGKRVKAVTLSDGVTRGGVNL